VAGVRQGCIGWLGKKSVIHDIYNNTLKGHDNFQKMQIAMARPPNLRDILCRSNIPNLPGRNTSDILASINADTRQNLIAHQN
jgi:hypothetical protein